jgi:ornithine carbamoyltransferase
LHCLPADITGISCKEGEVAASVFDRYRTPLYKQAGYKPYIIAAMIFLSKVKNAPHTLDLLLNSSESRFFDK